MNRAEHSHRGALSGGHGELSQADLQELAAAAAPPHLSASFKDAVSALCPPAAPAARLPRPPVPEVYPLDPLAFLALPAALA
jgi:hypothetical protein